MTEQEFMDIWLQSAPAPLPELEYRLYHDDNGFPLFYSTEDVPGLYIVVDKETYISGPKHARVIDGKLVETQIAWTKKLVPSAQGQSCDPTDVCVVVPASEPHVSWRLKHEDPKDDHKN